MTSPWPLAVSMRGVSKSFGSVEALRDVGLEVERGEIHAVVGENGAGKTTLMRILYGSLIADAGQVAVEGKPVRFRSAADGIAAGIGMVSQHYSIIAELSCLQNLMLGAEPGAVIGLREARNRAEELARRMAFVFDWDAEASTLSPAGAQKLEILKLLWRNARIMVLDEPTAMLSPADSDALFESLKQLAEEGHTVVLVTHRLPEVMQHCERVTVLRDGKLVGVRRVADTSPSELAEMIVGHALGPTGFRPTPTRDRPALAVRRLFVRGFRGEMAVKGADLAVAVGEVVGLAGVDGNGQRELFRAILGVSACEAGALEVLGADARGLSTRARIGKGVRLIPEDRHEEGVVDAWSLEWNAAIGLQRLEPLAVGARVHRDARRSMARAIADRFRAKYPGIEARMSSLSGGNQQRFVAARALAVRPKLLLAYQPARGLDVDATRAVYDAIRRACAEGAGALVVSYDLDELLEHCDRILVMHGGRVLVPGRGLERDRAAIGRLMVGAE